ncbi:MAG: ATP-dependent DNA ligase, partial [Myxococcota bacterium]
MLLRELVATHRALAATRSRKAKVEALAERLCAATPEEIPVVACWLAGRLPQGRIGVGPAAVLRVADSEGTSGPPLTLAEIDAELSALAGLSGPGSARERSARLGGLFARGDADERRFLAGLLLGELRQGASEGLSVDAIAAAAGADPARVRRAFMLAADLGAVAQAALGGDPAALDAFDLELF